MSRITPQTLFSDVWPSHRRDPETGVRLCRVCNNPIQPPKHYYCGDRCSELALEAVSWDYARRLTLRRDQGGCVFPGCARAVTWQTRISANTAHVHHIFPVKDIWGLCWDLIKEWGYDTKDEMGMTVFARLYTVLHNDVNNLVTYCIEHHKMVHAADSRNRSRIPKYEVARTHWAMFWHLAFLDRVTTKMSDFF